MTEIPEHLLRRAQEAKEKAFQENAEARRLSMNDLTTEERRDLLRETIQNQYDRKNPYVSSNEIIKSARTTIRKAERYAARVSAYDDFDTERTWDITLRKLGMFSWEWEVSQAKNESWEIRTSMTGTAITLEGAMKKAQKAIRRKQI